MGFHGEAMETLHDELDGSRVLQGLVEYDALELRWNGHKLEELRLEGMGILMVRPRLHEGAHLVLQLLFL